MGKYSCPWAVPLSSTRARVLAHATRRFAHALADKPPVAPGEREGSRVHERDLPAGRQVSRFETEMLSSRKNLKSLMDVAGKWVDRVRHNTAPWTS